MKYYHLRSLLSAGKVPVALTHPSDSFSVVMASERPYIEPTFEKVEFEVERPTVVLVSAVGATGKTALSEQLSRETGLPRLDLGRHKPVGDKTLTGLLTDSFDLKDLSDVFTGFAAGSYGVIIDGVDEGRSKTNEKAFEAFLDDVANLCKRSAVPTVLMLGRTQVIDECWLYLADKGVTAALVTIQPFTIDDARRYIDAFVEKGAASSQYVSARDAVLEKLGRAFGESGGGQDGGFLSFIGYPPVLDAIVTLLNNERNYHKLLQELGGSAGDNIEVDLLCRISRYILSRDREQRVVPNIVEPLLEGAPQGLRQRALEKAFSIEEQCVRLIAHCLGKQVVLSPFGEPVLDERYEKGVSEWMPEHPFVAGRQFRSAVFEAMALATLISSGKVENQDLVIEYHAMHKSSYHLVYMIDYLAPSRRIPASALPVLFASAMEFMSVHAVVELHVDGPDWEGDDDQERDLAGGAIEVEVEIEIIMREQTDESKMFTFVFMVLPDTELAIGPRLAGAFITVPCTVRLGGESELELTTPLEISAKVVSLDAKTLVLHHHRGGQGEVVIAAQRLVGRLEAIVTNGLSLLFSVADVDGISFPLIQYVRKAAQPPADPLLRRKYFRLRRILMEFRSHSKGALAKYKYKIESERVLKNEIGRAVLAKLVTDRILTLSGNMYYLEPDKLSECVGVTWQDLRKGQMPESLVAYLGSIT